jgi:hypothetical protein
LEFDAQLNEVDARFDSQLRTPPLGNFIRKVQGSSITVPRMFDGHDLKSRVRVVGLFLVLVCAAIAAVAALAGGAGTGFGVSGGGAVSAFEVELYGGIFLSGWIVL